MFLHVRQIVLLGHLPALLARDRVLVHLAETLRAAEGFRNVVLAAGNLPAITRHVDAVRVLVVDREVVVDVAVDRIGAHLAAAQADRARGMSAERPIDRVQVVHVLLDDVIATQPGEVIPVAQLPLHVAPTRLLRVHPDGTLVPVAAGGGNFADGPVVDALHGLEVAGLMAALGADADGDPLGFRLLISGEHGADAGPVHRHRLLGKDVLARGHGGLQKRRAESRRRGQDDVVHVVKRQHLLVGVEADELAVRGHVYVGGKFGLLEKVKAGVEAVLEDVAHGHQLDSGSSAENIFGGSCAALAAADQADSNHVAARGVGAGDGAEVPREPSAHHRGGRPLERVPARGTGFINVE